MRKFIRAKSAWEIAMVSTLSFLATVSFVMAATTIGTNVTTGGAIYATSTLYVDGASTFTSDLTLSTANLLVSPGYGLDAGTSGVINIGTSTASTINIGSLTGTVAVKGNMTFPTAYGLDSVGAVLNIGTSTATTINIGSLTGVTAAGGRITVPSAYGLDVASSGVLNLGTTTASAINIGRSAITTAVLGNLTIPGSYSIDAAGVLNIGTTTATDITIGRADQTVSFPGNVTVTGTLTQGNTTILANTIKVGGGYGSTGLTISDLGGLYANGSTTIDQGLFVGAAYGLDTSASGVLNIGTTSASSINIGRSAITTAVLGNLTVPSAYGLDADGVLNIGTTTATTINIGSATSAISMRGNITVPLGYGLDTFSAGTLNIGTTTADAINIGRSGITATVLGDLTVSGTFSPAQTTATNFLVGGGYGSTGITLGGDGGLYVNGSSTIDQGIFVPGAYGLDTLTAGILNLGTTTATQVTIGKTGVPVVMANASSTLANFGSGTTVNKLLFGDCTVDFGTSVDIGVATTTNCAATGVDSTYKVFMTPTNLEPLAAFNSASSTDSDIIQVQIFNTSTSSAFTAAAHTWYWMAIK